MSVYHLNYDLDAEDRKLYVTWLQNTLATYGAVILLAIALVSIQSTTQMTNVAMYMGDAVSQASP